MANQSHPFLDPLWRRILLVAFCAAWTAVEIYRGDQFWITLVGIATVYALWTYIFTYKPAGAPAQQGEKKE